VDVKPKMKGFKSVSVNLQGASKQKFRSVRDEERYNILRVIVVLRIRIVILSNQYRFSLLAVVPICREPAWVHVS
jgi:hypothetical protein